MLCCYEFKRRFMISSGLLPTVWQEFRQLFLWVGFYDFQNVVHIFELVHPMEATTFHQRIAQGSAPGLFNRAQEQRGFPGYGYRTDGPFGFIVVDWGVFMVWVRKQTWPARVTPQSGTNLLSSNAPMPFISEILGHPLQSPRCATYASTSTR